MASYGTLPANDGALSSSAPIVGEPGLQRQMTHASHLMVRGKLIADVGDPYHAAKVIRYKSTRLAHWGVIDCRMLSCTLFNCYPLWVKLVGFILLGSTVYAFASLTLDISKMDVAALTTVTNVLNGLIAFLLGLYIGKCLDRWWLVVYDCLGNVWEQLTALCMLTGTCFPNDTERDTAIRHRLLRYSVLANKMIIRALRTNEETVYLQEGVRDKEVERFCYTQFKNPFKQGTPTALLSLEEMEDLRCAKCRPQVVASWIQAYIAYLQAELIKDKGACEQLMPNWDGFLLDRAENIRRAIGCCERSLSTQLPFAYVHLITFVVLLNNVVLSIIAGLFVASGLQNGALLASAAEIIYVITITFVYQSMLELCACLLNPLDQRGLAAIPTTYCTQKLEENLAYCMLGASRARARFSSEGITGALNESPLLATADPVIGASPIEKALWEGFPASRQLPE